VKKSTMRDMTSGSPLKLMVAFWLPLACGTLFQQFYNMVDTVIVGKFLGVNALAGVGSTGSINFMILGFCLGLCSGFAIPVAQKFGQKDYSGLRRYVANTAFLTVVFSAVLALATCLLCPHILNWMNTQPEFYNEAYNYIFVIFLGIPASMLYNVTAGIVRSLGDSRTPLYFLIVSSFLNIGLDLLFIAVFGWGVAGAAWATVISQAAAGVLCLIFMMWKFDILRMQKDEMRLSGSHIRHLCGVSLPMGLQYSITAIGSVVIQTIVNGMGTTFVAATTTGGKVNQLLFAPMEAIGPTSATFAGQNIGAGRTDRVRKGMCASNLMGVVLALIGMAVVFLFGRGIAGMFIDQKDAAVAAEVLAHAQRFLVGNSLFYIALNVIFAMRFTIQGLGFSRVAMIAGAFEMVARVGVGVLATPYWGFDAICVANPAAWVAADIFLVPCYYYVIRKLERRAKAGTLMQI